MIDWTFWVAVVTPIVLSLLVGWVFGKFVEAIKNDSNSKGQ